MVITFIRIVLINNLLWLLDLGVASAQVCSYSTWSWNVHEKKAIQYRTVKKDYRALAPYERDVISGCSVCEQDQVDIHLPNLNSFKVCKHMAQDVASTLQSLIHKGEPIKNIIGYRVGLTRGR